jgi:SAM-dependent methyltransferase
LHDLYREMTDASYLSEERGRRRSSGRLLDLLGAHVPRGRLLEVGCGHGLLLDEARRRGYDVEGLELSAEAARYARDTLGLPVREMALEDTVLDGERYDAILMIGVLEHLDDPVTVLERLCALLAPGGALLIVTPDPSSLVARVVGSRWWSYLPAHFCLIPHCTLRELICARGLVVAEDVPYVHSFTPGYWLAGLSERGGWAASAIAHLASWLPRTVLLTASLKDERVLITRNIERRTPARSLVTDRGGATQVHVTIPAHDASRTMTLVADGLPTEALDRALLVDDASSDGTAAAALENGLEVLAHPTRRGYGASQKTGYVRALLDGADVVVVLPSSQCNSELVAQLVEPIIKGEADVVIGSHMPRTPVTAGGVPRWRWSQIGGHALKWVESRALQLSFSGHPAGYKAFSAAFLRSVPFLRNSDNATFDHELLAQIMASGARVLELPISTHHLHQSPPMSMWGSVVNSYETLAVLARLRADRRGNRWLALRRPAVALQPESDRAELPMIGSPPTLGPRHMDGAPAG